MISKSSAPPTAQECTIWLSHLRQSFWFLRHKCGISGKIRFNYTCNEIISFLYILSRKVQRFEGEVSACFSYKMTITSKQKRKSKENHFRFWIFVAKYKRSLRSNPGKNIFLFIHFWEYEKSPKSLMGSGFLPQISFERLILGCYGLKRCFARISANRKSSVIIVR